MPDKMPDTPKPPPLTVAFLLFTDVTQIDLTGPAQILSRLGNVTLHIVARTAGPVMTDAGFAILPTATFAEVREADILCVPGGRGTLAAMEDAATLDWLRTIAADAMWVTSVCTGSLLLGAAGLLTGYRATCHWASIDQLACFGATPVSERVVYDRNRVTGGGVTSGIDFALSLTAQLRGEAHAKLVQLSTEYDPQPPFDSGSPAKADAATRAAFHAMMARAVPGRAERVRAVAARLGFEAE